MGKKMLQFYFFFSFFFILLAIPLVLAAVGGQIGDWWGLVFINNEIAPNGSVVTAYYNSTSTIAYNTTVWPSGVTCTLSNCSGFYLVHVVGSTGDNVSFKVCGVSVFEPQQIWSERDHPMLNLSMNKTAQGTTCEYDCGCLTGYCVDGYCCNSRCTGACNGCDVAGSLGTCTDVNALCAGTDSSCYCSGGACQACASGYRCSSYQCVVIPAGGEVETEQPSGGGGPGAPLGTDIDAGETGTFTYTLRGLGIRSINVTANETIRNSYVTVSKKTTLPSAIAIAAPGIVQKYLVISTINLPSSSVAKIVIKFRVEKSWLTTNNVDYRTIALYKYVDEKWIKLPTVLVGEDDEYYYYEAETDSLSVFAVSGEERRPVPTFWEIITYIDNYYAGEITFWELLDYISDYYSG